MAIRRIASYLGATAGALALALVPTVAHAAPFNHIEVGGVAVPVVGVPFTGVGTSPITADLPGIGSITCYTASASGTIRPDGLRITSGAVTCPSVLPGMSATVAVNSTATNCSNGILLTPTAGQTATTMGSATNPPGYATPYDNPVTAIANFSAGPSGSKCISVTYKMLATTICSYNLLGSVPATFDEAPRGTAPAISQQLNLFGVLTVVDSTGSCYGLNLSNGSQITFSVPLNLTTPIVGPATNPGLIDFVP